MKQGIDSAQATPTKQFFVSMLTRDIKLEDAILDLIDNCLDGALRLGDGGKPDYSRYLVQITLAKDHFSIEDNCGGIPRDVAKNYAFKMGREPNDNRDSDTETIGMYGVGMKRAIFKMGRNAIVKTRHGTDTYEVPITAAWLDATSWDPLPINEPTEATEKLEAPGTTIYVSDLNEGVARHFANPAFVNEVTTAISQHFTMFLQWGLKIEINGESVQPVHVEVLVSPREDGPAPYVFRKTTGDVTVSITVGLNTSRRSEGDDSDDDADFAGQRASATAGWTVLCNDRAVIVGDKSRLTGWGDLPLVPLYHPQFAVITGIIEFRAKDAKKLPVTTTKRALDASSELWLESLVKMKEGMRVWISYTNDWKNHPRADQQIYWHDAQPLSLSKAIDKVASRTSAKKTKTRDDAGEMSEVVEFNPKKNNVLPKPEQKKPSSRRIVFSRPVEEIRAVSRMLFDDPDVKAGTVGDECFKIQLELVKPSKKRRS
ncbi:MAG: ATP-binding protein [Myxococcales bacterium]|nr:ATP-binding protein [Myxococcales bacterium]